MDTAQGAVVGSEVEDLYRAISKSLERIVRLDVHASDQVIEEACQFAWTRLVMHRSCVRREGALAWLVKTAVHEALRLLRRELRYLSLEAEVEWGVALDTSDPRPGPDDVTEHRDRLSRLSSLSARQQRLLWLYGFGLSYDEIAAQTGCTRRTVERQLYRARAALRAVEA